MSSGGEYMERLDAYRTFLADAGYDHLLLEPAPDLHSAGEINSVRMGIAGSTRLGRVRNGENGKLWLAGRWQAEHLLAEMDDVDVSVALIHHPAGWYVPQERNDFSRTRFNRGSTSASTGTSTMPGSTWVRRGTCASLRPRATSGRTCRMGTTSSVSTRRTLGARSGYGSTPAPGAAGGGRASSPSTPTTGASGSSRKSRGCGVAPARRGGGADR